MTPSPQKVALVTGAARGIGLAVAKRFLAEGWRVALLDIEGELLHGAVAVLANPDNTLALHCDVSDAGQVEALMGAAERLGGPHAIVSNAAIQYERTVEDTPPEDWDRVLGVNLKGVYLCARAAIPRMRALGGGSIVNMASVNGFWVEPALGAYCAAKGGVINLTRSIALENGRYGIRCNCICPGYIDTGMAQRYFEIQDDPAAARVEAGRMHALGRIGRPEEIAAMALFLCSDESGFCTAAPFVVDGGLSAGVPAI
jgi:NAD(P)-dependent dehydrogenase (short-subunit alcohol dehydrogenase family)